MTKILITMLSLGSLVAVLGGGGFLLHTRSAQAAAEQAPTPPPSTCQDRDGDGYGIGCERGPDCNDSDRSVHPGAIEVCNFRDDDCSGEIDDGIVCQQPPVLTHIIDVPAASFRMGTDDASGGPDERPAHSVRLKAFRLDSYEVTNGRYKACVDRGDCAQPALKNSKQRDNYYGVDAYADYPVVHVSWEQANTFCKAEGGRLPTEAEWEMSARGPGDQARMFPWGNEVADCSKANFGGNKGCLGDTDRVGRRSAGRSPVGADDMAGNVWEWTSDWYDPAFYQKSPSENPKGPEAGSLKVLRGGCFMASERSLRTTCRKAELPSTWAANVGFRCAYDVKGGAQ